MTTEPDFNALAAQAVAAQAAKQGTFRPRPKLIPKLDHMAPMIDLDQWAVWQRLVDVRKDGTLRRASKVPFQAHPESDSNGDPIYRMDSRGVERMFYKAADTQVPLHWTDFVVAQYLHSQNSRFDGIGFLPMVHDKIIILDGDRKGLIFKDDDTAEQRQMKIDCLAFLDDIQRRIETYGEESPGANGGVHFYGLVTDPAVLARLADVRSMISVKGCLDIIWAGCYSTVTGWTLPTHNRPMADISGIVNELLDMHAVDPLRHFSREPRFRITIPDNIADPRDFDEVMIAGHKHYSPEQWDRFMYLMAVGPYDGTTLEQIVKRFGTNRQPEGHWWSAVMALANYIARMTRDHELALSIFRVSPLWFGVEEKAKTEDKQREYMLKYILGRVWDGDIAKAAELDQFMAQHKGI